AAREPIRDIAGFGQIRLLPSARPAESTPPVSVPHGITFSLVRLLDYKITPLSVQPVPLSANVDQGRSAGHLRSTHCGWFHLPRVCSGWFGQLRILRLTRQYPPHEARTHGIRTG